MEILKGTHELVLTIELLTVKSVKPPDKVLKHYENKKKRKMAMFKFWVPASDDSDIVVSLKNVDSKKLSVDSAEPMIIGFKFRDEIEEFGRDSKLVLHVKTIERCVGEDDGEDEYKFSGDIYSEMDKKTLGYFTSQIDEPCDVEWRPLEPELPLEGDANES